MADLASLSTTPQMTPVLDKNSYLFTSILGHSPEVAAKFCKSVQEEWKKTFSKDSKLSERMLKFRKTRCLQLVWVSDKFGKSPSEEINELKTYRILSDIYDRLGDPPEPTSDVVSTESQQPGIRLECSHAEKDRSSERQLQQHLDALIYLFRKADDSAITLSEDLIKRVHCILMKDLFIDKKKTPDKDRKDIHDKDTCSKEIINAGEYRQYAVGAGTTHTYPDHDAIPSTMARIVKEYNERSLQDHSPFHLAAWLLYELLTIHPFEDGNGRVSRLMWCFSLLRDGLPFPVSPFPGHSKAYKQYMKCIERDRAVLSRSPQCRNLFSLTLISVTLTWKNFIHNLRSEAPEKYDEILLWLEKSGNALM